MSGTVITRWPAWEERPSAKKGCNFQPAHSRGESAATHQPSSSCLGALWWMQKEVSVGKPHRCGAVRESRDVCSPSLGPLRESDRLFFIRVSIFKMNSWSLTEAWQKIKKHHQKRIPRAQGSGWWRGKERVRLVLRAPPLMEGRAQDSPRCQRFSPTPGVV